MGRTCMYGDPRTGPVTGRPATTGAGNGRLATLWGVSASPVQREARIPGCQAGIAGHASRPPQWSAGAVRRLRSSAAFSARRLRTARSSRGPLSPALSLRQAPPDSRVELGDFLHAASRSSPGTSTSGCAVICHLQRSYREHHRRETVRQEQTVSAWCAVCHGLRPGNPPQAAPPAGHARTPRTARSDGTPHQPAPMPGEHRVPVARAARAPPR